MGACDLFFEPSAISAKTWFTAAIARTPSAACILGALLERQVASLLSCRWKRGVHSVIQQILRDALDVYAARELPVRRARVFLLALEMMYFAEGEIERSSGAAVQESGQHIKALLQQEVVLSLLWYLIPGL